MGRHGNQAVRRAWPDPRFGEDETGLGGGERAADATRQIEAGGNQRGRAELAKRTGRFRRFRRVQPCRQYGRGCGPGGLQQRRSLARFRSVENRRREPWVLESLQYLNHPLRVQAPAGSADDGRFVRPALDLLREVQQTGDIFFPTRWMESTLWGHRSPEVAAMVQDFLASELQYPQRLRWTILSAADELYRVANVSH